MAYVHPVLVKNILDHLFKSQWIDWEPETLEIELLKTRIPGLIDYKKDWQISNVIDALRAVLSQDSHALGEWHVFEKVVAAFSNKEVRFFDTQPPLPFELFMAAESLDTLLDPDPEYSEEVKVFIGLTLINNGYYAYPGKRIDSYIDFAINSINDLGTDQVKKIRKQFKDGLIALLKDRGTVSAIRKAVQSGLDPAAGIEDVLSSNITRVVSIYVTVLSEIEAAKDHFKEFVQQVPTEGPELSQAPTPEEEGIDAAQAQEVMEMLEAGAPLEQEAAMIEKEGRLLRPGIYRVVGQVGVDDRPTSEKYRAYGDLFKDTASGDGSEFSSGGTTLDVIDPKSGELEEKDDEDFDFGV